MTGTLVVDRYHAYNKAPCFLQYCYAHLLRDVEDVEKEFPDHPEVENFMGTFASLLASAMKLRSLPITDAQFYKKAEEVKSQILEAVQLMALGPTPDPTAYNKAPFGFVGSNFFIIIPPLLLQPVWQ